MYVEFVIFNCKAREITGVSDSVKTSRMLKNWVFNGLFESISNGARKNAPYKKVGVDCPQS